MRVLIDDSMTESDPEYLARFSAHPDIELRLYKPFEPEMARLAEELLWGQARLLVDAVKEKDGKSQTHAELDKTGVTPARIAGESTNEVLIQSAYLVLLDGGFDTLNAMTNRGVSLKLATNSMASNNHLTAFVGYGKQRKRMIETGAGPMTSAARRAAAKAIALVPDDAEL